MLDLQFSRRLGSGSNGDVLEAFWGGVPVAVKQFDLSKRSDSYKNEVMAYKFLRDAWSKHVPEPLFISASKSGNVRFIGMTKGRKLSQEEVAEDIKHETWSNAYLNKIDVLEREYKFRHMDVWNNGGNWILDEKKNVLIIDLEHWEEEK